MGSSQRKVQRACGKEYRQARERSSAEGSTQRDGASSTAIKEHCSVKTRARARVGASWYSRLERTSKEVSDQQGIG